MSKTLRYLGLGAMVVTFMIIGTMASAAPAAAQCSDPTNVENCEGSMDGYTNMLDNLYKVAHKTLQYSGFITIFLGAVIWFTARRSSDRAQTGVWLLIGGIIQIIVYFSFTAIVSLLKWVSAGSG
jgi:uncharacterized protein YjeT (DUF2065 family)